MSEIMLCKQVDDANGLSAGEKESLKFLLFKLIDGHGEDDKKSWRRFWHGILRMAAGELFTLRTTVPRYLPIHKRYFGMMAELFDNQERITDRDQFLIWIKIGAKWIDWMPGAKEGIVPIPKSISFAKCDEGEFAQFRSQVAEFMRTPHFQKFLWPKIDAHVSEAYILDLLERFKEL